MKQRTKKMIFGGGCFLSGVILTVITRKVSANILNSIDKHGVTIDIGVSKDNLIALKIHNLNTHTYEGVRFDLETAKRLANHWIETIQRVENGGIK